MIEVLIKYLIREHSVLLICLGLAFGALALGEEVAPQVTLFAPEAQTSNQDWRSGDAEVDEFVESVFQEHVAREAKARSEAFKKGELSCDDETVQCEDADE